MKSRRKIWSVPVALSLVLLFALMLGVSQYVSAQTPPNPAPVPVDPGAAATPITVVIGPMGVTDMQGVDGEDLTIDEAEDLFTDGDDLVFTAMTSNPDAARPVFTPANTASTPQVVDVWWDALGDEEDADGDPTDNTSCTAKAARLGFDINAVDDDDDGDPIHTPFVDVADPATGLCQNFSELETPGVDLDGDGNADTADGILAQTMVLHAFHWDMLSGAEMVAAATAAGESRPNDYKAPFGKLSTSFQADVASFFEDGVLAMGSGALTFVNDGIDEEKDDDGTPGADSPGEAKPGTATITVKASDVTGRLISPSKDETSDPRILTVEAVLTETTNIQPFTLDDDAVDAFAVDATAISRVNVPVGSGNKFVANEGDDEASPPTSDRLDIRVGPTTTKIGIVAADVVGEDLLPHNQKLNFSLVDGGDLEFQIGKMGLMGAAINVKSGSGLSPADSPYDFTLSVNEFGNAPGNSQELAIRVIVVSDNVPPVFGTGQPTSGTVKERSVEETIAIFTGTDANNQAVTFRIVPKQIKADEDADADEIKHITEVNTNASNILKGFDTTGFRTSGVLKTKTKKGKGAANTDQPNFNEDPVDNPDTEDVDESDPEFPPVNEYTYLVSLYDGTLDSAKIEFTLTVTDESDPLPGSDQKLNIAESNAGGADNTLEPAVDISPGSGGYEIDQQIDDDGNIVGAEEDQEDILFGIVADTGAVYLKNAGTLDYEGGPRIYTLSVRRGDSGSKIIVVSIVDVDEAPEFSSADKRLQDTPDPDGVKGPYDEDGDPKLDSDGAYETDRDGNYTGEVVEVIKLYVQESAEVGDAVRIGLDAGGNPKPTEATFTATDEDDNTDNPDWSNISYDLYYDADLTDDAMNRDELYAGADALVTVDSSGTIRVKRTLNTDGDDADEDITLTLRAFNPSEDVAAGESATLIDVLAIRIDILDTNVAPEFTDASRAHTHQEVSESVDIGHVLFTYEATDEDEDVVKYRLRDEDDTGIFAIGELTGVLTLVAKLDYEVAQSHTVEIQAYDDDGDTDEIVLTIDVLNVNDEPPVFDSAPDTRINVAENTPRGTVLSNYSATDADGDTVTYSLDGANKKSFMIDAATGDLMTLESLDYDSNTPCSLAGCSVTVIATDGVHNAKIGIAPNEAEPVVTIVVSPIEDSVSTLHVTKANPVPGTTRGDPMTALGNTKASISDAVPERPADLPNKGGAPLNFVETDWANWGTVLRIEVTAQSPDATCGSGNECVIINLNSDSAGDTLQVKAYRMDTPAGGTSNENKFVAAVMLVELDGDATDIKTSANVDIPVYKHGDGTVARLQVDEEDEIEIEFGNLRGDIDVENEAPEIGNFAPEHESAFDDPDVEYTFTVTDSHSGLPEPEDLPDPDGDDSYMPVVALISKAQCETADQDASAASKARRAKLINDGFEVVGDMANISDDESLYCPGVEQDGEYDASGAGYGFAPIRDDKDFDEIDDGFDVETTIVLRKNKIFYVTFVACDAAGNCSFFDPDGNDEAEELAKITVDTEDPVFVEARTGLTWDSTDNEYDDNRSYIQVIFNDLTKLNTETVEIDDFVVEGHSIKDVQVYENPDDDDVTWADSGRYGAAGSKNKRGVDRYRDLENVVFIELEDELLADETPDVTIVPNGVEDKAGNEQDDGDHEANDWISPAFTIVSIVSTRETSQDQVLAGDDDEVTVVVTSDERLDSTRPTVLVTYVNAPAGSVDTKGVALCDTKAGADEGTRERGEIVHTGYDDCADSDAAKGGNLNNNVEKVSNTEWIVTITEPKATGYYNFRIEGNDRSPQENPGSEGVSPDAIVTDFFDADGDVNVDDAIFFEGDINLPKPQVRVSGVGVEDNEADVEFRSPLFVELDFAANHSDNCTNVDSDERMSNCMNENSEYAEDNFDDIVVTSFVLDGVDITDSVKTTDSQSFLVSLESISIGDHTAEVQAVDRAGNVFEDTLEIDFEVNDRDPFEKRLSPGWNLVSLPGEPADSSIAAVFGPGVEVRTVYSYDPVIPGGWMVAVRETLDSDWQGDLTDINGQHGYWVLSDAIQDWEVSIPRLSGGAAGTGTPIQPPVIPLYAGWNLIPVTDISGNGAGGDTLSADVYLQSLDDGIDLARVLGFDTIRNQWETVLDPDMQMNNTLTIGSGYWIFVREATSLVPSGYVGGGGGD